MPMLLKELAIPVFILTCQMMPMILDLDFLHKLLDSIVNRKKKYH